MTPEEVKAEMLKVKVPWFIKAAEWVWFKAARYVLFIGILIFVPLFFIYESIDNINQADKMWSGMFAGFLSLMGIGLVMLVSHLIEKAFVKKQAKRLGITPYQWNVYAKELGLVSFKK